MVLFSLPRPSLVRLGSTKDDVICIRIRLFPVAWKFIMVFVRLVARLSIPLASMELVKAVWHLKGSLKITIKQPWKLVGIFLSPWAEHFIIPPLLGTTWIDDFSLKVLIMIHVRLALGKAKWNKVVCLAGVTLVMILRLVRHIPQQQGCDALFPREN